MSLFGKPKRPCSCGSGKLRTELVDARGIFVCFWCPDCEKEKKQKYRPEILTDPNYWHDEPLD